MIPGVPRVYIHISLDTFESPANTFIFIGVQWKCIDMTPNILKELKLPPENTFNAKICLDTFA